MVILQKGPSRGPAPAAMYNVWAQFSRLCTTLEFVFMPPPTPVFWWFAPVPVRIFETDGGYNLLGHISSTVLLVLL